MPGTTAQTSTPKQTDAPSAATFDDKAPDSEPLQQVPQPAEATATPKPRKSSAKKSAAKKSAAKKSAAKKSAKSTTKRASAAKKKEKVDQALTDVANATLRVSRRWGTGRERDIRLKAAGFDPQEVARERNRLRNS